MRDMRVDMVDAKFVSGDHRNGDPKIELDANKKVSNLSEVKCFGNLRLFCQSSSLYTAGKRCQYETRDKAHSFNYSTARCL